jgi:hypothetical protein
MLGIDGIDKLGIDTLGIDGIEIDGIDTLGIEKLGNAETVWNPICANTIDANTRLRVEFIRTSI